MMQVNAYSILGIWIFGTISLDTAGGMDPGMIDLLTPRKDLGEACGYESCPIIEAEKINVHIVPHTHWEMGYGNTFYGYYTGDQEPFARTNINAKRMLDFVISELWADSNKKFSIADFPYFFHWWSMRDGTVRRMVQQLLRQGRLFFVGGGWGMIDEATTSYHAIIDSYTYTLRKLNSTFLDCGRPLVSWQTDVFGHSREYASLMAQMGYDGHFIEPISFDDELGRMRKRALEFIWRGNDDLGSNTDIFTHKLFDGYWSPPGFCFSSHCTDPLLITSDTVFTNIQERVTAFIESITHRQAPNYATRNVMVIMGTRFSYYDASVWFSNIQQLMDHVNEKTASSKAGLRLFYSTPACYMRAVHEANPSLPTKQDDFLPLTYDRHTHVTGFYTSRPSFKYMVREAHIYLQISKQLQVSAKLFNNDKMFEQFNWIMGAAQDHKIITGGSKDSVMKFYMEKLYVAVQTSTLLLKQAFNKLRKSPRGTIYYRCSFNMSSCRNTAGTQSFVVIYNPLAWNVVMPVRVPVLKFQYDVFDPKLNKISASLLRIPSPVLKIPYRRNKIVDHEIVFMANVPPFGFKSYFIQAVLAGRRRSFKTLGDDLGAVGPRLTAADQFSNQQRPSRNKRSLIKKLKNKNKKYLIRQANNINMDDMSLLNMPQDYYDSTEFTTETFKPTETHKNTQEAKNVSNAPLDSEFTERRTIAAVKDTTSRYVDKENAYDYYNDDTTTEKPVFRATRTAARRTEPTMPTMGPSFRSWEQRLENSGSYHVESNDLFIKNKYIQINLDEYRKVTNVTLCNGVKLSLDIQYFMYVSDYERPEEEKRRSPGVFIFTPIQEEPEPLIDEFDTKIYKSDIVEEIHTTYSKYASIVIKLYIDMPYIEVDWLVGPIPVEDGLGKNIFLRYTTDLSSSGKFYTDSNGRQTVKRIRNSRPMYSQVSDDRVATNYYPVTSKIYIEDRTKNIRFSVLNDRAQGGTSLNDGEIDLMLHRRILTDDVKAGIFLNETEYGSGVIVRGKHYLYVSKADYKPNRIYEKKLAKEIELGPQILVSPFEAYGFHSLDLWRGHINEFSGLKGKLPLGVHLLTFEKWNDNTLLIRLENYLEKCDVIKTGVKRVFLKDLFSFIKIKEVKETTLAANIWLKDWNPLQWRAKEKFVENFNFAYGNNNLSSIRLSDSQPADVEDIELDRGIVLTPQQIRTFTVYFEYINF